MKEWLLSFLHILVVGERQTLGRDEQRCGAADDSSSFATREFQQIAVHFLRHGAAARRIRFWWMNESVLLGRKQQHLFRPAAEMKTEQRKRIHEFQREVAIAGRVDTIGSRRGEAKLR